MVFLLSVECIVAQFYRKHQLKTNEFSGINHLPSRLNVMIDRAVLIRDPEYRIVKPKAQNPCSFEYLNLE